MRLVCLLIFVIAQAWAGTWITTKVGPFAVYSEANAKETRQCAAELEQMRFSLGELLGRHDLTVRPQLHLYIFRNSPVEPFPGVSRTGAIVFVQGSAALTQENRKSLARILLEQNIGRMPEALEKGLQSFLSTTQINGAKVTWGAPPAVQERTPEWNLVHWLITNPDTYGNVRVLLSNMENGVAEDVAYQNAFHRSKDSLEKEVKVRSEKGSFSTIDAPSRPLSPERDLMIRPLENNDALLHLADLLNQNSEERYRTLLAAGVHKVEAEEGLAMLATRQNDAGSASRYMEAALAGGSKNGFAIVECARVEKDLAKRRSILEKAIEADPNFAEAHFLLAQQIENAAKKTEQLSIVVKLAPRREDAWVALAEALQGQQRWSEAAKAWRGAEQAASSTEEQHKLLAKRMAIEGERLDFEEAERRRDREAQERETNRLKQQAIAEVRAAEARIKPDPSASTANVIPWDQLSSNSLHAEGQMLRVECAGHRRRIVIRQANGKLLRLNVDTEKISVECGPQQQRPVSVDYEAKANARTGVDGNAVVIVFR